MRNSRAPLVWGTLLVLGGLLFLAQSLNILGELSDSVWVAVFAIGSLGCFVAYAMRRRDWWLLIPGFVLGGLAATTVLDLAGVPDPVAGSIFLWTVAAAFWAVFLADMGMWWAIIPAGVMTTIGSVPLISGRLAETITGAVIFLGLAITFGILYVLRGRYENRTAWAIFPALGCLAMALLLGVLGPFEVAWPVVFLILPGLYLLYNALRRRSPRREPEAPGGPGDGAPG
jgi:hypothetical protein